MKPVLQIDHLSISFTQYRQGMRQRELPVIRDLSLTLYPGQIGAVVVSSRPSRARVSLLFCLFLTMFIAIPPNLIRGPVRS